jgi:hypothetical protein
METAERTTKISPEIYVYATNKNFLNVYDALRIDKLKIEIAGYDQATKRQTGHANAWLDKDDARLLAHLICNRLFMPVTGGTWEKFGGSDREDGSTESRTLSISWDEGEGGRFARFPYRLTIANGPGKRTATGGVSPAGEPTSRLSMRMPELDLIKLMLRVQDYICAYETAHHHRLVADKIRELRTKMEERSNGQPFRSRDGREPATRSIAERPERERAVVTPSPERRTPLTAIRGGNSGNGTGVVTPVETRFTERPRAVRAG